MKSDGTEGLRLDSNRKICADKDYHIFKIGNWDPFFSTVSFQRKISKMAFFGKLFYDLANLGQKYDHRFFTFSIKSKNFHFFKKN